MNGAPGADRWLGGMGKRSLPVIRSGRTRANEFAHGTRLDPIGHLISVGARWRSSRPF